MNKKIIVALFGKAGAGKDSILKEIIKESPAIFHALISTTTRPPREGEQDGVDYRFISETAAELNVESNNYLEYATFRGWTYGTLKSDVMKNKINIGVFNLTGIKSLMALDKKEYKIIPIYINCSDKTRLMRQLSREKDPDCAEIVRRYTTDEEDFRFFSSWLLPSLTVINEYRSLTIIVEELLDWLCDNLLLMFLQDDPDRII